MREVLHNEDMFKDQGIYFEVLRSRLDAVAESDSHGADCGGLRHTR